LCSGPPRCEQRSWIAKTSSPRRSSNHGHASDVDEGGRVLGQVVGCHHGVRPRGHAVERRDVHAHAAGVDEVAADVRGGRRCTRSPTRCRRPPC
jgi:hypothetical protein